MDYDYLITKVNYSCIFFSSFADLGSMVFAFALCVAYLNNIVCAVLGVILLSRTAQEKLRMGLGFGFHTISRKSEIS